MLGILTPFSNRIIQIRLVEHGGSIRIKAMMSPGPLAQYKFIASKTGRLRNILDKWRCTGAVI